MKKRIMQFRKAEKKDIGEIAKIEEQYFGEQTKYKGIGFKEDILNKWFEHNPEMFFVVTTEEIVQAFVILVPVTEKLYNLLKENRDELKDLAQFDRYKDEVLKAGQTDKAYGYYLADIACCQNNLRMALLLIQGMNEYLAEHSEWVIATPITDIGLSFCKKYGFRHVIGSDVPLAINQNCELYIDEKVKKNFLRLRKSK